MFMLEELKCAYFFIFRFVWFRVCFSGNEILDVVIERAKRSSYFLVKWKFVLESIGRNVIVFKVFLCVLC